MKYPHTRWTLVLLNLKGFTRRCGFSVAYCFLHRQNNEDKAKGIANFQENLMRYLIRISSTKLISKFLLVLFFVLGGLERINCKHWDPKMPFHLFKQSLMPSLMSLPNSLILPFFMPNSSACPLLEVTFTSYSLYCSTCSGVGETDSNMDYPVRLSSLNNAPLALLRHHSSPKKLLRINMPYLSVCNNKHSFCVCTEWI